MLLPPKPRQKPAETVSFRASTALRRRLEQMAKATGRNTSETVSDLLEQAFALEDALGKSVERTMHKQGLTFVQAVVRLAKRVGL
jgi:predicted transcriptional regulator